MRRRRKPIPIAAMGAWAALGALLALAGGAWAQQVSGPASAKAEAAPSLSPALRSWVAQHAPFLLQEHLILGTWQWLGLLLVVLFGVAMGRLAPRALGAALGRWLTRADAQIRAELNAILTKPVSIAVAAWIWWVGLNLLDLPEGALIVLLAAVKLATALAVVWTLYRMAGALGHALAVRAARTGRIFDELLAPILAGSLKVFIVAFGLVFIADLFDLPLKSVLAGLGLGGLAVALAAKDVLSNVIGSLTILLDRPFKLGDWIVMDKVEGSVEAVGIRSTRLRTAQDSVVAIPNSQLMGGVIDNMGERRYRRLKCQISAACDTAPERIEAFCEGVREIIRRHPYTRKQDYHVWLNDLAPSSLNISLSCFLETPDGATELRERHRLLLDIIRLTRAMGVELALPPQAPSATSAMADGKPPAPPAPEGLEEALRWGRQEARNVVARNLQTDSPPPPLVRFDFPEGES